MNHKSSIWFDGREYRWNDKHNDYTLVADGETKYREAKRLRYKNDLCKTLIRYAAQGAQGIQGIQGIQGVSGISGTKPSIWYRGYEYEWDEKTNEYVRWVRKGKGPATPFTLKEAVGNDLKKYDSLIKKSQTKKATAKPKKAKKPEPPKFDFTKLAYKGFTASDKDVKKFKASLKKLDEKELEEAKNEITQYVGDFRQTNKLSYFDEKHKEAGAFGQTFRQAIQDELDSRKPKEQIIYPTLDFEGCKSIDEYKKYLESLKSDDDVAKQKKKIFGWGADAVTKWSMNYGMKLSGQEYLDAADECKKKVGDISTELLRAVDEETKARREEAVRRRKEELERRKAEKTSSATKNKREAYRPDISHFPEKISETRELKVALGGSTGAKMVEDSNGVRYIKKTGNSAEHIVSESYADAFYQAAGVKVPGFKLYDDGTGAPVKLATVIDDAKPLGEWWGDASEEERDEMRKKLRRGYAADVLLGNWDVVGMDADNILIDKDGEAWRIDNGGSMGFRAQGAKKNSASWGNYIDDLFTMTGHGEVVGRSNSSTITKYFGDIRPLELAKEINNRDWSEALGTLPEEERNVVENRLEEIRQIAERGEDNEQFGRTEESTDKIIALSYQYTRDGARDALPKAVSITNSNLPNWRKEAGWLYGGNVTATINGKDYRSFSEYLADKMGADNFNAVETFNSAQGTGSYEELSVRRKLCILKAYGIDCLKYSNLEDFLKDVEDAGYYCSYNKDDTHDHRKAYKEAFEHYKGHPDLFKQQCEAVEQFDAAVQLMLENVQLDNVDPVTRTVILGRTEKTKYFKSTPDSNDMPNEVERTYHHTGVCESHSRFQYTCVEGYGLTVVRVPFSRIHGLWIMQGGKVESNGYKEEAGGQFLDSGENENIADTHGLIIIFMKDLEPEHGYGPGKKKEWDAKPFVDKFLQWEKDNPDQVTTVLTGVRNHD